MQSFVAVAGAADADPKQLLHTLAVRGGRHVPSLGGPLGSSIRIFPEVRGGWVTWGPTTRSGNFLHEHIAEEVAVLVFGGVTGAQHPAEELANAFARGGVHAVRGASGTFTAVIVDRKRRHLHAVSDRIGRLVASYWATREQIYISVHEVLLGLCGCPFELDRISAAATVGCDWSVSGGSLNRHITRLSSVRGVSWRDGVIASAEYALFGPGVRLPATDKRAIHSTVVDMAQAVTRSAQQLAVEGCSVEAGLTAGLDSRAVLAALLSAFDPERIRLYTTGGNHSRDVVVAKRIARLLGIRHEQRPPERATAEGFRCHDILRAFMANGDTSARGSLAPLPVPREPGLVIAGGGGGEIFRGFYYRNAGQARTPAETARALCARKFRRLGELGLDPGLVGGVTQRLEGCFERYATLTPTREDWLDLFYVHERFARFAAVSARKQEAPRWLAFADPGLVELAWRLPAPLASHCYVHAELIRAHMPRRIYWMSLNGKHPPAWEGEGMHLAILRRASRAIYSMVRASTNRVAPLKPEHSPEYLLATEIYDYAHALLTTADSIALELFDMPRLVALLEEHRLKRNRLNVLGPLINMEHFRLAYLRALEGEHSTLSP